MKKSEQIKQQIIENWLLYIHHDDDHSTKKEIPQYIEEDHVDEIEQSGLYDVSKINWSDLRNQKGSLVLVLEQLTNKKADKDIIDSLEGILSLIDSIQDHAVDVMGFPYNEVFNDEYNDLDEEK